MTVDYNRWDYLIKAASKRHGVPWRWIKAIMWNESSYGYAPSVWRGIMHPDDVERSASADGKSWGLMQTTRATAEWMRPGTTTRDLNIPEISIEVGTKYLAYLMRVFGGDREKTVRAYNGGPGFMKTEAGRRDTPVYYAKFEKHLELILNAQPGDEREIA